MYQAHKDLEDSWEDLMENFKFFGDTPPFHLPEYSSPGGWNIMSEASYMEISYNVS